MSSNNAKEVEVQMDFIYCDGKVKSVTAVRDDHILFIKDNKFDIWEMSNFRYVGVVNDRRTFAEVRDRHG